MFKPVTGLNTVHFRTRLGSGSTITLTCHNNIGLGSDALSAEKTLEGCHAPVAKEPTSIFFFHQNSDTISLFSISYRCFIPGVNPTAETKVSHYFRTTAQPEVKSVRKDRTQQPFEHLSTRKIQENVYGEISDSPDGDRRLLSAGM
jgi:hypothetical protein